MSVDFSFNLPCHSLVQAKLAWKLLVEVGNSGLSHLQQWSNLQGMLLDVSILVNLEPVFRQFNPNHSFTERQEIPGCSTSPTSGPE
jgi:hypothetical protein